MKKNNEKNYMLFIYGNFKGGDKLVSEIMSSLEPVLSSDCLKFTYGDFGIVAHFRTTYSFNELSEYCKYVLNVWVPSGQDDRCGMAGSRWPGVTR